MKLQKEFVAYCNSNGIDYHKYELKTDSPKSAFEDAYAKAKQEVAEKKGELPFPLDD